MSLSHKKTRALACWPNCLVVGWELLAEQVHFQLPGLFVLEYTAPALSLAQEENLDGSIRRESTSEAKV